MIFARQERDDLQSKQAGHHGAPGNHSDTSRMAAHITTAILGSRQAPSLFTLSHLTPTWSVDRAALQPPLGCLN